MSTIPKIIHYCWIGGNPKSPDIEAYIASWKKYLPDYEIIEWNESNFDLENSCEYVKQAYAAKKWAFVTDYMRLSVLEQYGGIYLDTDVEIKKSFDSFLNLNSFMCFECSFALCTAVIGTQPHAKWIQDLLDMYKNRIFIDDHGKMDTMPNSKYLFNYFQDKYPAIWNLDKVVCDEITIFPSTYFSPLNYSTGKMGDTTDSYAIHYYQGTWKTKNQKRKDQLLSLATRIIGEKNRQKITKLIKGE